MKRLLFTMVLVLFAGACSAGPQEMDTLKGHVTLGPMLPAMPQGMVEPTPAPEAYAVRQIVIYAEDGEQEIARAQIDSGGTYEIELPVGTYLVDINHAGVDRGIDLPRTVEIASGQVTRLDVIIDTGAR
ncbi:MAG: hypothetical protein GY832_12125 [Chloroflexi bacterium]|nr:hypothetical protein [Chloroflexota bacterium]